MACAVQDEQTAMISGERLNFRKDSQITLIPLRYKGGSVIASVGIDSVGSQIDQMI